MSKTTPPNTDRLRSVGLEKPDFRFDATDHALIIGAGLAGCATAKALSARGMRCTVFDANDTFASATSKVPVAVFRPPPRTDDTVEQEFLQRGFERLLTDLADAGVTPEVSGLVQVVKNIKKVRPNDHWQPLPDDIADKIGDQLATSAVYLNSAGALIPARLCQRWLDNSLITLKCKTQITAISQNCDGWVLTNAAGLPVGRGTLVVLANAHQAEYFAEQLSLIPAKGQISHFCDTVQGPVVCERGYAIPVSDGIWSGATFHRGDKSTDTSHQDDECNRQSGNRFYPIAGASDRAWAGVRCTTLDRMPLIGAIPDPIHYGKAYIEVHHGRSDQSFVPGKYHKGMYCFVGLGSRGVVQALHGAECLADIVFGSDRIAENLRLALHPARFLIRKLRRPPA